MEQPEPVGPSSHFSEEQTSPPTSPKQEHKSTALRRLRNPVRVLIGLNKQRRAIFQLPDVLLKKPLPPESEIPASQVRAVLQPQEPPVPGAVVSLRTSTRIPVAFNDTPVSPSLSTESLENVDIIGSWDVYPNFATARKLSKSGSSVRIEQEITNAAMFSKVKDRRGSVFTHIQYSGYDKVYNAEPSTGEDGTQNFYLSAPKPRNERERMHTVRRLDIVDTPPEAAYDHIVCMVARMLKFPVCFVSIVDSWTTFPKAKVGTDLTEVPREESFCSHVVFSGESLIVPDLLEDERFRHNPFVAGGPRVRFYAGMPLKVGGHTVGTLCVLDYQPRDMWEETRLSLADFGAIVARQLDQRMQTRLIQGVSKFDEVLQNQSQEIATTIADSLNVIRKTLDLRVVQLVQVASESPLSFRPEPITVGHKSELDQTKANAQAAEVAKAGRPVCFAADGTLIDPDVVGSFKAASAAAPVYHGDRELFGVVSLYSRDERTVSKADTEYLKSVSALLSGYIKYSQDTEDILKNILPNKIASHLKKKSKSFAKRVDSCSILFADIVGFTTISSEMAPTDVVNMLFRVFSVFDKLTERRGLEKVKTIGDAYMACGGVTSLLEGDHATAAVELALDMLSASKRFTAPSGEPLQFRIGVHTGHVVAGVLKLKRLAFDVWGDTVNVAARMETTSKPGCVRVSPDTWLHLDPTKYRWQTEEIDVKGKGLSLTYLIKGRKLLL